MENGRAPVSSPSLDMRSELFTDEHGQSHLGAPNVLPQLRLALAARRAALTLLAVAAFLAATVLGAVLLVPGLVGPLRVRV